MDTQTFLALYDMLKVLAWQYAGKSDLEAMFADCETATGVTVLGALFPFTDEQRRVFTNMVRDAVVERWANEGPPNIVKVRP